MASYSLLVVDDEEMNREVLSRRLERHGYQIALAEGGREALNKIKSQKFDLVLLDVMMPEVDGLEVLSTIRETYSLIELPVIMVTARDQSGDIVAALQLGANDYVTKPLNFPVILARIQNQLAMCRPRPAPPPSAGSTKETVAPSPTVEFSGLVPGRSGEPVSDPQTSAAAFSLSTPTPGFLVGDYEILHVLGRGGMGVVYKARHQRMNRITALKIIDPEHLKQPQMVRRFHQEMQAAAQLSHPNIVLAYDAGQIDDMHFLAMEYVEGMDLEHLVKQQGPLPIPEACDLIAQTALGLQHAHERGLVHRDIKPSNLLVTPAPRRVVKILDMGLALLQRQEGQTSLTQQGTILGTIDYMAPEQCMNSHAVDIRADIYSLGCTFYFVLTGKPPFAGDSPVEVMLKHHLDEPPAMESLRPDVPPRLAALAKKMMAKQPEQRPGSPAEVAESLRGSVGNCRFAF